METLDKKRPSLFRLASDTDEKDNDGMGKLIISYSLTHVCILLFSVVFILFITVITFDQISTSTS